MTGREESLVETGWLAAHLQDPDIRIVDMRGVVQSLPVEPGVEKAHYRGNREAYLAGHIPGAVYIDWTRDIVDPSDPVPVQVAPPELFAEAMARNGIGSETLVIAYDDHPALQFATRLWWALRYYDHTRVRVLHGGWGKWVQEHHPVSTAIPDYPRATFTPRLRSHWRATVEEILSGLSSPACTLIDARDKDQYRGALRRGSRGGHIPGAINLPREHLFQAPGQFLPPEKLREVIDAAGISPERPVTAYCNGGVAATSLLFALDTLGFPDLANYDGSWNEWGERQDLPVEKG